MWDFMPLPEVCGTKSTWKQFASTEIWSLCTGSQGLKPPAQVHGLKLVKESWRSMKWFIPTHACSIVPAELLDWKPSLDIYHLKTRSAMRNMWAAPISGSMATSFVQTKCPCIPSIPTRVSAAATTSPTSQQNYHKKDDNKHHLKLSIIMQVDFNWHCVLWFCFS